MKLIFAVDALRPPLTGIGRYTWELATRLRDIPDIESIRYYRNGQWLSEPSLLLVGTQPTKKFKKIPRILRRYYLEHTNRNALFHSPNYFLPSFTQNGVVTVHDLSIFKFPETHPVERVKQFEKSFLRTLGIARHIITDSECTRQEIIDYFGWPQKRITAIHLGVSSVFQPVDTEILQPRLDRYALKQSGYTLCVSTIEPRKRVDRLIEAYSRLPASIRTTYPLVIIGGKGWQSETLHTAIDAAQREGWLHYLGYVDEVDLPLIYAGARLFVYPSIYEGFGLPIAEAMACGVPVITSNRSCLPEIAAGAAKLIDPDDLDAFTQILEASLHDFTWRDHAIAQGLQVAKKYTWDSCVQNTVNVYKTLEF